MPGQYLLLLNRRVEAVLERGVPSHCTRSVAPTTDSSGWPRLPTLAS
jgi:hypothetical protein